MSAALDRQSWPPPALSCRLAIALCEQLEGQAPDRRSDVFFQSDTHEPRLYFHTPFEGGGAVTTGAYSRQTFRSERVVQAGAGERPAAEVLEAHLQEVAAMVGRGAVRCTDFSRDGLVEATQAFYRSPYTSKPSPKRKAALPSA